MKRLYNFTQNQLIHFLTFLLLLVGFSTSAQQIITEHNSVNAYLQYFKPNFDRNLYTNAVDRNGNITLLKNSAAADSDIQKSIADEATLNINFIYEADDYYISSVLIFNEVGFMYATDYNNVTNSLILNVPNGNYDIITEFEPINSGQAHVIVKEMQAISGNTTIQINAADAIHYIATTGYDENGAVLQTSDGSNLFFFRTFYFNPSELTTVADFYFTNLLPGQTPEWNFYINDVSNRYSVVQTMIGAGFEQGNYFTKFPTLSGISENVSIANNPADWSYHSEEFQPTQLSDNQLSPGYIFASTFNGHLLTGWGVSAGGILDSGETPFKGFLNNLIDNDPADMFVIPAIVDRFVSTNPTTGGTQYFMKGNAIFSDGNGGIIYGSGDESFNSHNDSGLGAFPMLADDYYAIDNNIVQLLPYHPRFTFDNSTTPSVVMGNNVPITITGFNLNTNQTHTLKIANKGRYGETRETDYLATHIEVRQNDNSIFSGFYKDFASLNLLSSGQVEMVLTNANTLVETLPGINTTTIKYNADLINDAPPTLQHLQFRNANNEVTNVFNSAEGATIRLAAADFKYNIGEDRGYYEYVPGNNVTVSYSLHQENIWTSLAVIEYPQYFQMPAFGDYYEASLSGIANENNNVWYDLKVVCTDASGNTQEQIISPAFKIGCELGVTSVVASEFSVYPNPFSELLTVIIPESIIGTYNFKVIDMTGRTIYNKSQSEKLFIYDGSKLLNGIYIFTLESNGQTINKKVVKD